MRDRASAEASLVGNAGVGARPTLPSAPAELAVVFDDVAESYDAEVLGFFAPVAGHLLDRLALRGHEALLDIGCGSGAVLTAAGWRLGPRSEMTGIDASARMIERARGALRGTPAGQARLLVMDGQRPELSPGAFDLITASMVLFFLPDPSGALRSWSRLLRPGGRVGITSFGEQTDAWRHLDEAFEPFVPRHVFDARTRAPRGVFASDEALADCFQGAGFPSVETSQAIIDVVFDDVDDWHRFTMSNSQSALWESVSPSNRPLVLERAAERLEGFRGADGRLHLEQHIRVTIAQSDVAGSQV